MRRKLILIWLISAGVLAGVVILCYTGILSTPRDFSSPETVIRLVDQNKQPVRGVEVSRNWRDNDQNADGGEKSFTDQTGVCRFAKIPARVGLFTGALRKAGGVFASCGVGSGASTTIYVRYHGQCTVQPKGRKLQPFGQSARDAEGVYFNAATDSLSNTLVELSFPGKMKSIEYALISSPRIP